MYVHAFRLRGNYVKWQFFQWVATFSSMYMLERSLKPDGVLCNRIHTYYVERPEVIRSSSLIDEVNSCCFYIWFILICFILLSLVFGELCCLISRYMIFVPRRIMSKVQTDFMQLYAMTIYLIKWSVILETTSYLAIVSSAKKSKTRLI